MVIEISNLRKPGVIYDSSKLAILGNMISGSIERTKNKYVANSTISGNTIKIKLKVINPNTNMYVSPARGEQSILSGRISNFLNDGGVSHDIKVTWGD